MRCAFPTAGIISAALLAPAALADNKHKPPPEPVGCVELATNPANGLAGAPGVKSASSALVALGSSSYCQVNILYGESDAQNINIRVGLPLNSVDGGTGGVEGAWNGRTQGIGGGGCSGSLNVNGPVSAGYVGSGNDTGHSGGDCTPGVNEDGTYNLQFINDFIRNGMKQQILFAKAVAKTYYAQKPAYNYWNGCSTGGRQGYVLAQELGSELDGILANAPAIYWTRFQTEQMWGQIVMRELLGGPIAGAKLSQASASAVAACDASDGVADGIIDDPRTCAFSAQANVCGTPTAPASNCLTLQEADAIDRIWDGPRNSRGDKIWFGLDRGTSLGALNGTNPFFLGVIQLQWDTHDRNFDWKTVSIDGYAEVAQQGSRNIADVTDTFGDLDKFRKSGGKLLTLVGMNDQLIMPRGVVHYYRQMASRYGKRDKPDFDRLQEFYRLFRVPGAGHCSVPNGFPALVDWVENGVAPEQIIQTSGTRTRPMCPYPQKAIYQGTGSTDDAANFFCGGDLETREVVCNDVLVKYKHEVKGPLDFRGMGVNRRECKAGHGHHDDDDD
ncbi:MAG TPA: tannase/feruloyl esterase family alpha/beta hydrolase [Burkholderiales bacterium]|nr:tannase/feruloyl esterase family alpha/beta hydrolase [Burkholderiales bacterium]